MAVCVSAKLMKRVGEFLSDFIRKHYGFLAPSQVQELRDFRTEVEDKFYPCHVQMSPFPPYEVAPPPKRGAPKKEKKTETDLSSLSSLSSFKSSPTKTKRTDSISSISSLDAEKLVSIYKDDSSVSSVPPPNRKRERSDSADYAPPKKTHRKSKRKADQPTRQRRRAEVAQERIATVMQMLAPDGPNQSTFEDGVIIRKALDWDQKLIPGLLVTDSGDFYVKSTHGSLGTIVYQSMPNVKDRYVFCNSKRYKCSAVVIRTFLKLRR